MEKQRRDRPPERALDGFLAERDRLRPEARHVPAPLQPALFRSCWYGNRRLRSAPGYGLQGHSYTRQDCIR
jgi:hypothetical protein